MAKAKKETEVVEEEPKTETDVVQELANKFPEPEVVCYIAKHPRTLVLVGTTTGPVRQPDGTVVMVPTQKPIKLVFKNPYIPECRVTKEFAESHGMTLAQMVEMIENHSQYRSEKEIWRRRDGEPERPGKKGPSIVTGPRGSRAF